MKIAQVTRFIFMLSLSVLLLAACTKGELKSTPQQSQSQSQSQSQTQPPEQEQIPQTAGKDTPEESAPPKPEDSHSAPASTSTSQSQAAQKQSTSAYSLEDYEGSWIDTKFNQSTCDDCLNSIQINSNSPDSGTLYFVMYNTYRVTDSGAEIKLRNNNTATFQFNDDSGRGTGTITLEAGQIKIKLKLSSGQDNLKEVYNTERTFVRDPYKNMTHQDPIALIEDYARDKDELDSLNYKLDSSVEWNEDIDGTAELKIVVGVDENNKIIKRFSVNTLTGHIRDLSSN
ncbi:hypothetical protein [Paenibacillus sp. SN-8-1]|uniref:hypothetical protein n=1 Tax=Paenibacillus sp. SN-8-1 TaxID=3435409 RepID=UPI003D9A2504